MLLATPPTSRLVPAQALEVYGAGRCAHIDFSREETAAVYKARSKSKTASIGGNDRAATSDSMRC